MIKFLYLQTNRNSYLLRLTCVFLKNTKLFFFLICLTTSIAFPELLVAQSAKLSIDKNEIVVTGTITDISGVTMPGVSIFVKGTKTGAISDRNGQYSVKVPNKTSVLIFSFIGYNKQEIIIGNLREINIALAENIKQMDEVVVVGYGTSRRRDLTGSVSSVTAKQLKDIPISSAAMAIQGKMPGVQITQTEGAPDAEIKIRIRGGGSITQDNSPLYIVDGFPIDNMSVITPSDIASIDVLKDASSTAIYGARGANGVIIITTKSGSEGKPTVSYNTYFGIKNVTKTLDVLDPYEYAFWQYEAFGGGGMYYEQFLGRFEDQKLYNNMETTNWQKKCFGRTGSTYYNNLSVNGGSKVVNYNISVTHDNSKEIMVGSGSTKTNFSAKFNFTITDWMSLELNTRLSDQIIMGGGTDRSGRLQNIINYRPVEGIAGLVNIQDQGDYEIVNQYSMNPYKQTLDDYRKNSAQTYNYNTALNIKLNKNLTYRFSYGMQYGKQNINSFYGLNTWNALVQGEQPIAIKDIYDRHTWQITNTLNFTKKNLFPDHNLNAMIGQELNYSDQEFLRAEARYLPKYIDPEGGLAMMDLGNPQPLMTRVSAPNKGSSFFGRVTYDYKGKYQISGTIRADGSSKFAPGNQWGVFPSVGAYWRISDESFMTETKKWLSDLKLRASFGQAGNNRISDDVWRKTLGISSGTLFIDNSLGSPTPTLATTGTLDNPELKWETTITRNLGLDFSLFNQRLSGSIEVYKNSTIDLLMAAAIPAHTGYTTQWRNIGQTSNKGLEISLNGIIIDTKDFKLSGSFNIAFNKNRIDKLGKSKRLEASTFWGESSGTDYLIEEGGSVGLMYGYETDGMYTQDDFTYNPNASAANKYTLKPGIANNNTVVNNTYFRPGSLKFKKQNIPEDTSTLPNSWWTVNATDDRVVLGDANPKHTGGFSLTADYKGIDFTAFFNWVYGNSIYNINKLANTTLLNNRKYRNLLDIMDSSNRYIIYNPETGAYLADPAESAKYNEGKQYWIASMANAPLHSWAIEDGSFLRLNNVTIGYSLPKSLISKVKLQQLRIYVTGYNLWLWTKYSGYDPEVDMIRSTPLTPGADYNAYPRSRSYNLGLNLTF